MQTLIIIGLIGLISYSIVALFGVISSKLKSYRRFKPMATWRGNGTV